MNLVFRFHANNAIGVSKMEIVLGSPKPVGDRKTAAELARSAIVEAWLCGLEEQSNQVDTIGYIADSIGMDRDELREYAEAFGRERFIAMAFANPVGAADPVLSIFGGETVSGASTNTCGTCACGTASCGTCHCGTGTCGTCLC